MALKESNSGKEDRNARGPVGSVMLYVLTLPPASIVTLPGGSWPQNNLLQT